MTILDASTSMFSPMTAVVAPPAAPQSVAPQPTTIKLRSCAILHAAHSTPAAGEAALKSLRWFKPAKRRLVWCNTAELTRAANQYAVEWGRKFVDQGNADMVVVCGAGAREIAMAARDAGLPLGHVVVCHDDATARNVLGDSVAAGDVVLALGVGSDSCQRLAERLESKFELARC